MIWYTVGAIRDDKSFWNYILCVFSLILILFSIFIQLFLGGPFKESYHAKAGANIRQVHLAIESFHSEYDHYPENLEELAGKNERKKVFHTSLEEVIDDYEMKIVYDTDNDGFVEVEGEKVKQSVAVWTMTTGEMIKSWDE